MTQTLANRMTTNPNQPFAVCSPLSVRHEDLNKQTMIEVSGGLIYLLPVAIAVVACIYPQQTVEATDWCRDRVSEGIDWVTDQF